MMEQNLEEKFIFLEISGEQGNLETYKRVLSEAYSLGIKRILLACIWDGQEERGEELLKEVSEICSELGIESFPSIGGYKKALYSGAMVGNVCRIKDTITPDITSMISLKEYKTTKALEKPKNYMDNFMKKLEKREAISIEEPVNEKHLVTLDEEFIEKEINSFDKLLKSPLMGIVDQAQIDTDRNLSLSKKINSTSLC